MPGPSGFAARAFQHAMAANIDNIKTALAAAPGARLLDVGCDDGENTLEFARAANASDVHGFEAVEERAGLARERGVQTAVGDLTSGLPYDDASFDVVVSNQVIEHLHDTDAFVRECGRVVRPGGIVVTSTENLGSWHNVFAVAMGWQPFSLTNVSGTTGGLGNPLALFRGHSHTQPSTWQHVRVFAYLGLRELFSEHGLPVEKILGAGYFPLPASVGRRDPRHAVFITAVARRAAQDA
jgi:SAM-dependent methyltransferase